MFKLARAWAAIGLDRHKVRRLAGLFLFEFVVVLLGVMAAQAAADWAEDRRLTRAAEIQFREARESALRSAQSMHFWATVGPCLIDRVKDVSRAAANGESLPAARIGRPALPWMSMPEWDSDVRRAAVARYGQARMNSLAQMEAGVDIARETTIRLRDAWSTFLLLDPANGTPSDADRANVRLAAIRAIDHIRVLVVNTPAEQMQALGIDSREWQGDSPVADDLDSCGLIRNWQQ